MGGKLKGDHSHTSVDKPFSLPAVLANAPAKAGAIGLGPRRQDKGIRRTARPLRKNLLLSIGGRVILRHREEIQN